MAKQHREIEAKILNVNPGLVQQKLKELGAKFDQEVRLDQVLWLTKQGSIRIRKSSDGSIRLTFKKLVPGKLGYQEWEIDVENYNTAVSMFDQIIPKPDYRLEFPHKRQNWYLDRTLININWYPRVKPLVEIEAKSEKKVRDVAKLLGFDPKNLVNKGIVTILSETLKLKKGQKVKL